MAAASVHRVRADPVQLAPYGSVGERIVVDVDVVLCGFALSFLLSAPLIPLQPMEEPSVGALSSTTMGPATLGLPGGCGPP